MKFGSKFNKRSDIPSFREFLSYEKIIKESGYNEDSEIEVKSNASKEQKEKYIENKLKSGHNKNTTEKQIKAINKEKYKLIKENGLLKEEIENYRKSLEKDKKEIQRLKSNELTMKEKETEYDVGIITSRNKNEHEVIDKKYIQEEVRKLKEEVKNEKMDVEKN